MISLALGRFDGSVLSILVTRRFASKFIYTGGRNWPI